MDFLKSLGYRKKCNEWYAVESFMKTKDVNSFVNYLVNNPVVFATRVAYETRYSQSGRISLCEDIMGPVVKIDGIGLIDCEPGKYGVSSESGDLIYNTILGHAPVYNLITMNTIRIGNNSNETLLGVL